MQRDPPQRCIFRAGENPIVGEGRGPCWEPLGELGRRLDAPFSKLI